MPSSGVSWVAAFGNPTINNNRLTTNSKVNPQTVQLLFQNAAPAGSLKLTADMA
jgi:hypothetical protein